VKKEQMFRAFVEELFFSTFEGDDIILEGGAIRDFACWILIFFFSSILYVCVRI
jgi:hypothetical protein